jgi:hypothetical protein
MIDIDTCNVKKSLPVLIALLLVAQVDLASAFGWPQSLLSLLHLTAANNDLCIDVLAIFQLVRMWAKRALQAGRDTQRD